MTLRYDHLTGGVAERQTHYLVRRYLKFGWSEWDGLPWWQQRAYLDGLRRELAPDDDGGDEESGAIDAAEVFPTS